MSEKQNNISKGIPTIGPDCECKTLQCYSVISSTEREHLFKEFQKASEYCQNYYVASMLDIESMGYKTFSVHYMVSLKAPERGENEVVPVCKAAFIGIHGLNEERVTSIYKFLIAQIYCPDPVSVVDWHCLPPKIRTTVRKHIEGSGLQEIGEDLTLRATPPPKLGEMYARFVQEHAIRISLNCYTLVISKDYNLRYEMPYSL